jgi:hypothetical protein
MKVDTKAAKKKWLQEENAREYAGTWAEMIS